MTQTFNYPQCVMTNTIYVLRYGETPTTFSARYATLPYANYDLQAQAVAAGRQYDFGSKKYDFGIKATPLTGEVNVNVNFDEASLSRAIAKVSGQVVSDSGESERLNVGSMGSSWQAASDKVGWQSNGNYGF